MVPCRLCASDLLHCGQLVWPEGQELGSGGLASHCASCYLEQDTSDLQVSSLVFNGLGACLKDGNRVP